MTDKLTTLESSILEALLAGDHPVLAALRAQLPGIAVSTRRRSDAGFFSEFVIDGLRPRAPVGKARIADVIAKVPSLTRGAGFVLYVEDGYIAMLEGYSYEEPWPSDAQIMGVSYVDPQRAKLYASLTTAMGT